MSDLPSFFTQVGRSRPGPTMMMPRPFRLGLTQLFRGCIVFVNNSLQAGLAEAAPLVHDS